MMVSAIARSRAEPHAAASSLTHRPFADQFDPGSGERRDHLHERVDVAADYPLARLHPLNGRQRKPCQIGQGALVDAQKGARGAQLRGRNNGPPVRSFRSTILKLHFKA
jgi:hypothetical protein